MSKKEAGSDWKWGRGWEKGDGSNWLGESAGESYVSPPAVGGAAVVWTPSGTSSGLLLHSGYDGAVGCVGANAGLDWA